MFIESCINFEIISSWNLIKNYRGFLFNIYISVFICVERERGGEGVGRGGGGRGEGGERFRRR